MAKISPVAAKYIVHSSIVIDGVVDRPDVIGAVFGQTEGLLGSELELRELQRSGRIGRIEVNLNTSSGRTSGEIIIPSSLDKTETAIVAAALEVIQRIGPCTAKVEVGKIEDVRVSKRQFVIERAKSLLRTLTETTMPDSQELADEVAQSVRMLEVTEYGRERLAAGPSIEESEEIVVVEGRADVLNMLKQGFKNVICLNGTSVPQTVRELTKRKTVTLFVDGDRGGDLITRAMLATAEVDFVCKAPDGKEVEELTKKEIHKALRGRITAEQAKLDLGIDEQGALKEEPEPKRMFERQPMMRRPEMRTEQRVELAKPQFQKPVAIAQPAMATPVARPAVAPRADGKLNPEEKRILKQTMEDLFGTRGACLFDQKLNVLGKVPLSELASTIKSLEGGVYALALDGIVDGEMVKVVEKAGISYLIATGSRLREPTKVIVLTEDKL
ncbi:MAG: DNA primase DnaG [Nanoarchaeota archaeon]